MGVGGGGEERSLNLEIVVLEDPVKTQWLTLTWLTFMKWLLSSLPVLYPFTPSWEYHSSFPPWGSGGVARDTIL